MTTTFAGGTLDRAGSRRADPAWVAERLAAPTARAVVGGVPGVLVTGDEPALVPLGPLLEHAGVEPILLGLEDGDPTRPIAAVDLADLDPALHRAHAGRDAWAPRGSWIGDPGTAVQPGVIPGVAPGTVLRGLRDVAGRLGQAEAGLLAYAAAMLHWRRTTRHCGRCGAATESADAGFVRACPRCGLQHHPRTDPVVIMLVADGDRALLGRQPTWPAGRYSALAGFVEPGESLEAAVAREVREEADVEVRDVRYVTSQPWPFPGSLMLGFETAWAGGDARVADAELDDVRWFDAAELEAARREEGPFGLPPREAIARRLIEGWLARRAGG